MAPPCTDRPFLSPGSPLPSSTTFFVVTKLGRRLIYSFVPFLLRRLTRTPYFQGTLCKKAGRAGCLRRIATCSVFTLLDFPPRPRLTFSFRLPHTQPPGDHRSFVRPPGAKAARPLSRFEAVAPGKIPLFDVLFVRRLIFQRMLEARNRGTTYSRDHLLTSSSPSSLSTKVPALSRRLNISPARTRGPVQLDSVVLAPLLFA